MLKLLNGTINANKEALFLRVFWWLMSFWWQCWLISMQRSCCVWITVCRVEWGKRPLKDHLFSVKQKLNVFRKVISFSDNGINYKPSMKNVQSFHVIRFLTKIKFVPRGHVTPPMGQNTPQSDKAIRFKHLQQNQSTGSFSLKLKKNNQ